MSPSIQEFLTALTQPAPLTRDRAIGRMERTGAVTQLISSLEHLSRPEDRRRGGFNDWDVARRGLHARTPRFAKIVDVAARRPVSTALHGARAVASLALLAPTGRRTRMAADAVVVGTSLLLHPRSHYGTDGTDQVGFLVSSSALASRAMHRKPALVDAALWGVGLQATLSYAASGWVKVTSRTWRSGEALTGVTRTMTYGDADMHRFLSGRPKLTRVLGTGVLGMECLFPVAYAQGGRIAAPWLHSTALFHVVNARVMGLGRFVWAFGSMHPAVLYTADARNKGVRSDTMPKLAAAMGSAAWAAGFAAQTRRRRRVVEPVPGERTCITRAGNHLVYREAGTGDGPVVILEHGLLSSPLLWRWTEQALESRVTVVTYARAGYGASRLKEREGFHLGRAAEDLIDLARHVGGDRGAVVAGHSLGGWIAVRAATKEPGVVKGLVLVDSSHPGELQRSSRQGKGRHLVTQNLQMVAPSLSAGLGSLMDLPDYDLPEDVAGRFEDQFRDGRLWSSGLREWRATQAEFDAFDGALPSLDCPLTVLTASHTAALDPVQHDLHAEMAHMTSGPSTHEQVPDCDHEGVLTRRRAAAAVADHIARLAEPDRFARTSTEEDSRVAPH